VSIGYEQLTAPVEEVESSERIWTVPSGLQRCRVQTHRLGSVRIEAEEIASLAAEEVSGIEVPECR
jgi:hypothetical protein